jgi:hypothetical protein
VWSVSADDDGSTGISADDLAEGSVTPGAAGILTLTAAVANGAAPGTAWTRDFAIPIKALVALYKVNWEGTTMVDAAIESLDDALGYIKDNAAEGEEYLVELNENQSMAVFYSPAEAANIRITLQGGGTERRITWNGQGSAVCLFRMQNNATLTVDNNITLDGNDEIGLIYLSDADLYLKAGSKITGTPSAGLDSAIRADNGSSGAPIISSNITMSGGEISGNSCSFAINIPLSSYALNTFTMTDGVIKDNGNSQGGGLVLGTAVNHTMSGGEISGHTGYGVNVPGEQATFTMSGNAVIKDNEVGVNTFGNFIMESGTIANNNTLGVYISSGGKATMTGGIVSKDSGDFDMGIRLYNSNVSLTIDGTVVLSNIAIAVAGASNGNTSVIYLGENFSSSVPIKIDLVSPYQNYFNNSWANTDVNGRAFLKGLPVDAPTGITQTQFESFVLNKAYILSNQGVKTNLATEGTLSYKLDANNHGIAKWTANP